MGFEYTLSHRCSSEVIVHRELRLKGYKDDEWNAIIVCDVRRCKRLLATEMLLLCCRVVDLQNAELCFYCLSHRWWTINETFTAKFQGSKNLFFSSGLLTIDSTFDQYAVCSRHIPASKEVDK